MDFAGNFRFRGRFDVKKLSRMLAASGQDIWSDAVARIADPHRKSRGVFLKNDIKPEHLYGTYHESNRKLLACAEEILHELRTRFSDSYLIRVQFSRHLPGDGFDAHTDQFSYTLMRSHRVHVPIITNEAAWFSVENERLHMGVGEAWEINNARVHAGNNAGDTARVHMIVDFATPLYTLEDRVRYLQNLQAVSGRCGFVLCRPQLKDEDEPEGHRLGSGSPKLVGARVTKGLAVSINFELKDADSGKILAKDDTDEPLTYVHGEGQLPRKVEKVIDKLSVGRTFEISLRPEEGFGKRSAHLLVSALPSRQKVGNDGSRGSTGTAGRQVMVVGGQCPIVLQVSRSRTGQLTLDANHPFAGRNLSLSGAIRKIRALDHDEYKYAVYRGPTVASNTKLQGALVSYLESSDSYSTWVNRYHSDSP